MAGPGEPNFEGAHCTGMPTPLFFPERGSAQVTARNAKAVCNGGTGGVICPAKQTCLEYALTNKERFGIWGGLSERQRAKVAKDRRVAARKHELEIEQTKRRRSIAAKQAWENRRRGAVASRPTLRGMLAKGLITRSEYDQEQAHQEHKAALAAIRSTDRRGRTSRSRQAA